MYSTHENVRIVIALLKEYQIRHIVLNPGGTNIPIVQAVQDDDFFHCYSVPDERSTMYFAIGLHLQTGEKVATSCTSAQATRNYLPGLTEAFYKHVPILAITTSKLERYEYQDYMQAPDQCSLPRDAVKKSYDLPQVVDVNTRVLCQQRAREAMLELTHHTPGPVQLNIRIDDRVQSVFDQKELPSVRTIKRYEYWDDWSELELKGKKILVVIGEHRPFTQAQTEAIDAFTQRHHAAVYTNNLSNFHGRNTVQGNLLVSSRRIADSRLCPDIVITVGGQTGDYSIFGALSGLGERTEVWRVDRGGDVVDTYGRLTKVFVSPDADFFKRTATVDEVEENNYFTEWETEIQNLVTDTQLPLSNLYVAQQLHSLIPENSYINFAILNSLRCWNYFPLKASVKGFANVAAFGIDGCTSMLIGESVNTEELCFLVTGDLAFFYDMNALGIRHIRKNVRILLINNHTGAEFRVMTRPWKDKVKLDQFVAASGHNGTAKGWAEDCGFVYLSATTKEEFEEKKFIFVAPSEQPVVFEVTTNPDDEVKAIQELIGSNSNEPAHTPKAILKKVLGPAGTALVKNLIKQ